MLTLFIVNLDWVISDFIILFLGLAVIMIPVLAIVNFMVWKYKRDINKMSKKDE